MFLLIDNYDSFTYNLVQAFYSLGQNPVVVKNDDPLFDWKPYKISILQSLFYLSEYIMH